MIKCRKVFHKEELAMKFRDRKIFLVTLATLILPNFPCVKVVASTDAEIFVIDENYKMTKSSAQDWLNSNDKIIFYGGGGENFSADIFNRQIAINGGTFSKIFAGLTSAGNVFDNELWINGGKIEDGIFGGVTSTGSVIGNKIYIQGGEISGDIIAGKVKKPLETSTVENNVINIYGEPNLKNAKFNGGFLGSKYATAGNILNINTAGLTIGQINSDSFEKIYFNLPDTVKNGETILNIADGDIDVNKISFAVNGNSNLKTGDKLNLVINNLSESDDLGSGADIDDAIFVPQVTTSTQTYFTKGATQNYELNLDQNADGSITATVGNFVGQTSNPIPQSDDADFIKAIIPELDPFTEMMTDAELYKTDLLDGGKNFSAEEFLQLNDYKFFFNSGNKTVSTKSSGGNIKTSRGSYALGFARSFKSDFGKIYVAPVFESASGNYTATLSNNILGNGKIKYSAGGIIARLMQENGLYFEGSFRAGKTENNFASNDFIISGYPTHVTYTMEAPILTGHLRFGDAIKIDKNNVLDLYGIYFATRQSGKSATLSTGDNVNFNSAFAQTFRLGYRLTTKLNKVSKIYSGIAWQYEKNSDSIATAQNYFNQSDGATGSSGMIEFGWQIKPNKFTTWTLDLNATGWVGRQQGFNIFAKAQKSF